MSNPTDNIVHDDRPWGWFKRLAFNEECTVKLIKVDPGESLSLQYHHQRDEMWMAIDAGLEWQIDGVSQITEEGTVVYIKAGQTHRVIAHETPGRFMEVAYGTFDEEDIVRLEDSYGRA